MLDGWKWRMEAMIYDGGSVVEKLVEKQSRTRSNELGSQEQTSSQEVILVVGRLSL